MKQIIRLIMCLVISFSLIEIPMMKSAHAGMITTNTVVEDMTRTQTEKKVIDFMERSDVKNQMISFGVSSDEASERVAHLSDGELNQIAGEIDHSVAGGEFIGILGLILVVVLIIYLLQRI